MTAPLSSAGSEMSQVSMDVAMAKKSLDAQKMEGEAAVALIDSAGQATKSTPVRAQSPGLGSLIDFYA